MCDFKSTYKTVVYLFHNDLIKNLSTKDNFFGATSALLSGTHKTNIEFLMWFS